MSNNQKRHGSAMKPLFFLILLLGLLWAAPSAFAEGEPQETRTQLLDQIVAVVNDEPVTQSELDSLMRPVYEQYRKEFQGEKLMRMLDEVHNKLLNQLIEDKLVFQEAKSQKIEVDEGAIEEQLEEFKKRFKSENEMEDAMRKEGLAMNDMRERLRRQAMIRKLHDNEIRSKIVVSPIEINDYYEKNRGEFSSNGRLRVRSITIKKTSEARQKGLTDEAAKNKIQDLRIKIVGGEDFARLAKQYSEDTSAKQEGLSEWIEHGAMIPVIDEVIFKLKTGEISDVIETEMGYHLFRVEESKEPYKKNLEEVRDEIYGKIFSLKAQQRFQEWTQELKRNAYISIR